VIREKRTLFLQELAITANVAFACALAGIDLWEALDERDVNPDFERQWRRATDQARDSFRARAPRLRRRVHSASGQRH
jgi:hypothetical protein